jgi:hypothetical protein
MSISAIIGPIKLCLGSFESPIAALNIWCKEHWKKLFNKGFGQKRVRIGNIQEGKNIKV